MDVIAQRELKFLESEASHPQRVLIEIGRPEPAHDGRDWGVAYRLTGPHCDGQVRYGYGSDSLDALTCALRILPAHVEMITRGSGKLLLGESEDLGLLPTLP